MIVDSSAIIAILKNEDGADAIVSALFAANLKFIAAPTYLETCMVASANRSNESALMVDQIISRFRISVVPFTAPMARIAVEAFQRYGKGQGHKAQLNFGDCMSYAVSKVEGMPLLFKGEDFRHTDVEAAI